jgi:hypothetical protein
MNILKTLKAFYSEHEWVLKNDDYESLHWGESNSIPKPSLEELEEKWENNKSPIEESDVQEKRQMEILATWPMERQFEAITEFHMQRPDKLNDLLQHIESVKEKYPKSS